VALLLLGIAGCSSSGHPVVAPTPTPEPTVVPSVTAGPVSPSASPSPRPAWVVGARPLPLRPDGFGEVLATPAVLRNRRLPTLDVLPPPADGRFHSRISPITPSVRRKMGSTYKPGCPIPPAGLRYVTLVFHGFDGKPHTGELVVNAKAAESLVRVFRKLYALRFPIEQMQLPASGASRPTGDGNDTVSFNCRVVRTSTKLSAHAYGLAIDVNPFQNPYHKGDLVLPELASAYLSRGWVRPGMLVAGSPAVQAFMKEGWTWGGTFRSLKDFQHFSLTGG
jgi:hypothetical protein